jgi:hypothetical protein
MSGRKVYEDQKAVCAACQQEFKITAREKMFADTLGYRMPKRCGPCRKANRKINKNPHKLSIRDMFEAGEFSKLFEPIHTEAEKSVTIKNDPPPTDAPSDPPSNPLPPPATPEENIKDINRFFCGPPIDKSQPEATLEDIKVLMTKANNMSWPDDNQMCRRQNCSNNQHNHESFRTADGKSLIRAAYGVESSKDLRKPQIEFLHDLFGNVLAGRAYVARDPTGTVFIKNPTGDTEEEVRRKVLEYD